MSEIMPANGKNKHTLQDREIGKGYKDMEKGVGLGLCAREGGAWRWSYVNECEKRQTYPYEQRD